MREDEAFVGRSLVCHLGGANRVRLEDGEDPPDLVLVIDGQRVGVEVTRLAQFTVRPDGSLGNRATDDSFGLRVVDDLNSRLGPLLPDDVDVFVHLEMPADSGGRFRTRLFSWIQEIVAAPELGFEAERRIEGAYVRIRVIRRRLSEKRIVGLVGNDHSSPDVGFNARLLLEDRIHTKHDICKDLPGSIWLALFNDYWLADADSYQLAFRALRLQHCFKRIFLVSDNGHVAELRAEA